MTKKRFLEEALQNGGLKGRIYGSLHELKRAQGTHYGGILRVSDKPTRSVRKKKYTDQTGTAKLRRRLYDVITTYNVVIADSTEEGAENVLEGFLASLAKGYYDEQENWLKVTPVATDWVDEDDSAIKTKVAVQVEVTFEYGIYREDGMDQMLPDAVQVEFDEEDEDG